jgi:hypothetical protein
MPKSSANWEDAQRDAVGPVKGYGRSVNPGRLMSVFPSGTLVVDTAHPAASAQAAATMLAISGTGQSCGRRALRAP